MSTRRGTRRGSLLLTLMLIVASIGVGFAMQDRNENDERASTLRTLEAARIRLQREAYRTPDNKTIRALRLVDAAIGEIQGTPR